MRSSILSFVLSLFVVIFSSPVSYGKAPTDCQSYIKTPESLFCIPSREEEKITQKILKNTGAEIPLLDPVEIVSDNLDEPPDSAFFLEDENGGITDQPRVFNDFSKDTN